MTAPQPSSDVEQMRRHLRDQGLADLADPFADAALPSIRLRAVSDDDANTDVAAAGRTRLGGRPDLPPSTPWPRHSGRPLSCLAQLDLAAVHHLDVEQILPRDGVLTFFYDAVEQPWGFDPADAGGGVVLHTAAGSDLVTREHPSDLPPAAQFPAVGLAASGQTTFVPWESSTAEALGLVEPYGEQGWRYVDVVAQVTSTEAEPIHRLLGHPDPIQGDMQVECQLVSHGFGLGHGRPHDPRVDALVRGASDWRLLLQIDSDDAGMMWGDVGRVYFWIRRQDLAARAWDRVWTVLQCT